MSKIAYLNSHFCFLDKMVSPNMSKTAYFCQKYKMYKEFQGLTMPHYMKFLCKMIYTTTNHIIVDYNLELIESKNNMPQLNISWSTPCTIHTLIFCKPQTMWYFLQVKAHYFKLTELMFNINIKCSTFKSPFWSRFHLHQTIISFY